MNLNILELEKIKETLKKKFSQWVETTPHELNINFDDALYEEMKAYEKAKKLEKIEKEKLWKEEQERMRIRNLEYEEKHKKEQAEWLLLHGEEEKQKKAEEKKRKAEDKANSFVEKNKRAVSGYSAMR